MRGKKAVIFNMLVLIVTVVALLYGYIVLSGKTSVDKKLGENPSEMILKIQEGEKALIFVDLASKLAVQQALYELQAKGGITTASGCGTYYGFNLWNSESGGTCYVNKQVIEKNLRELFESNLVARLASYPTADFLTNTPAAGIMKAGPGGPGGISAGTATYCSGAQDLQKDFDYTHSSSNFYPAGGSRLFIPAEANCPGSYDLVIFLHGCKGSDPSMHSYFGDKDRNDIIPIIKNLLQKKAIQPIIAAAPTQTKGNGWKDNPTGVCGSTLWGYTFDFKAFIEDVKKQLPTGITIKSVSFMGHSGAGCTVVSGIHRALQQFPDAKGVAQIDTCPAESLGSSLKSKASPSTSIMVIYGEMGSRKDGNGNILWTQENSALGISKDIACPPTDVPGGQMRDCQSSQDGRFVSYWMQKPVHANAVGLGAEQFLLKNFPATAAVSQARTGTSGCIPGQTVGIIGDSITNDGSKSGGYVTFMAQSCQMNFQAFGIDNQKTSDMLPRFKTDILDKNFNQVIIFAGTNDNMAGRPVSETIANLQSMYSQAKAKGMRVIAVTIPPMGGATGWDDTKYNRMLELNTWIKTKAQVDVVADIYDTLKDPSNPKAIQRSYVRADMVHPSVDGHKRMSEIFIVQAFQKQTEAPTKT